MVRKVAPLLDLVTLVLYEQRRGNVGVRLQRDGLPNAKRGKNGWIDVSPAGDKRGAARGG